MVAKKLLAGRLQRLACKRHVDDLARSKKKSYAYRFDVGRATRPIDFCSRLRHTKGRTAGKPFEHAPWQVFLTGCLFGWVHKETGDRRFQTIYVEVGKKNGKSFWSACIALYLAFFDDEPGAEVYSAATSAKQAKNVWEQARQIVESSPALLRRIDVYRGSQNTLAAKAPAFAKFEMLSSDYGRRDGLFPSGGIIDELHEHKNRGIWDIVEKSSLGRDQPMIIATTTAGHDRTSFCWKQRSYSVDVLEGHQTDDSWFAFIATIDEGDDWKDPKVWPKANPSMGVTFTLDSFKSKVAKALSDPQEENSFRRYHLNQWTEQHTRWMTDELWEKCSKKRRPLEELSGELAFGGMQLAWQSGLSAFVLVVPDEDGALDVFPWFWCPETDVEEGTKKGVPLQKWVDDGDLVETSGNTADFGAIEEFVGGVFARYGLSVGGVFFNRQNGSHLATRLIDDRGMDRVIGLYPGFPSLSEPTNRTEKLFKSKKIRHGNNPVMRRMFQHVAVKRRNEDPETKESELMIDRQKSEGVVGMEALVYAIYGMLKHESVEEEELQPVTTAPIGWG